MNKLFAKTGVLFLKMIGYTPFWLLYIWADMFYFISYHLIGYRKKTVHRNLKNSFPEKTEAELKQIERAFYHHFSDLIFETMKSFHMSEKTLIKRVKYINPEVLDELYAKGKNVALLLAHYGNWEWPMLLPKVLKHQVNAIYRPIQNATFDNYMKKNRSRFGIFLMPARISLRTILELEKTGQLSATCYLTDQTALKDTPYWITFLNQETAVFPGPEKVASRLKQAVVFMELEKIQRGYYEVKFTKLFDDASQTLPYEVTKAHTKFLEDIIRKKPEYWLWSHKRWKHTRPEHIPLK